MKSLGASTVGLGRAIVAGWDSFWFTPADPATLCLIRLLAGAMLFYTHAVWTLGLDEFFGPHSWVSALGVTRLKPDSYTWSYFWLIDSRSLLWTVHIAALVVFALLTVGLFTRVVSVLALVATLAYVHRTPGALFGLDQINVLLATYLALGPSGATLSLDRWFALRRGGAAAAPPQPSVMANIAIRLIQLHMCIIYLFAGTSKLTGLSWWNGTAMWLSVANLEYQSLDMTWLARWPKLVNLMTHVTVFWEIYYCALIWPRRLRPLMLLLAVPMHLGIAVCLGMITFGLVMLIGNVAFIPPEFVRRVLWPVRYQTATARAAPLEAPPQTERAPRPAKSAKR